MKLKWAYMSFWFFVPTHLTILPPLLSSDNAYSPWLQLLYRGDMCLILSRWMTSQELNSDSNILICASLNLPWRHVSLFIRVDVTSSIWVIHLLLVCASFILFFVFQTFDTSALAMSNSLQSLETILQPLRQLFEYRSMIHQIQSFLHQLQQNPSLFLPPLATQLLVATRALQHIEQALNRIEYQLLCIVQLQLQHTLDTTHVCGVDAVKGPCAVSIFSVLCVLLVIVIVNRVGGVGGGC